jgi:hypothetical protein
MARLLADSLAATLANRPDRPACLVNIAGGAAADSWNALIHVHAARPELLVDRRIVTVVLDLDSHGPAFGQRAFGELCSPGAPLSGLEIVSRYVPYHWADPAALRQTLDEVGAIEAACAVSSEGGLFEYGSDTEILANLEILYGGTAFDTSVVGSVTRDGEPVRLSQSANRVSTRPRTLDAFRALVLRAGWIVREVYERPFTYNVSLVKV